MTPTFFTTIRSMARVWHGLILRNIRTRFFGTGAGFLIALSWPLVHIGILLAIQAFLGRAAPYGDSSVVFFATGLVPYMTFLYMSRYTMLSANNMRVMLSFPIVKVLDLVFASAVLEVLSASSSIIVLIIVLTALGENLVPLDPVQAGSAMLATILFGMAWATANTMIVMAFSGWMTFSSLFNILMYVSSGVFFVPSSLPPTIRYYLSFNPLLQLIEWMRSAYYDGYGEELLDRKYILGFSLTLLFFGLLVERVFRGRLLTK